MTKRGASGTRNINATLHAMTSAAKPKLEGWAFAEGDPIIYLVNDYRKELWNGSLGRIEKVLNSKGRQAILCSLDGARREIPEEDFYHLDLAYAITVHKAQGSQFKRVIVPIVRTRLLDRTLIYTALTRGSGTGGVRRRPARLQCGRHRAAPCARATGRLLHLNSDAPLVSLFSKMLLESHLGTNAINPGGLGAKPPGKFKCRLGNPAIWRSSRPSFRLKMAWAEDRALLGSNPSADPGAEMGRGRVRLCPCCLSAG